MSTQSFWMKHEDFNDVYPLLGITSTPLWSVVSLSRYSASPNRSFMFLGPHCVCNSQARSPLHSFINNFLAQGSFIVITKAISSGTISYYLHFHVNQDPACIGNKIATFIALFLIK